MFSLYCGFNETVREKFLKNINSSYRNRIIKKKRKIKCFHAVDFYKVIDKIYFLVLKNL